MADYGIFGKGSSGNGWFTNKLNDFHDSTKKYDPLGHYSVENPMKTAHWLVEKSSGALADAGIGEGWNTRLNQEANENGNNFGLGATRMGVGVGSVLGAMYGYGAAAGEGAGAGAGAGVGGGEVAAGNGAFLGEGVASGVPAWDGAAGGMGLGVEGGGTFNPNGMPEGSSYAQDIPTNNAWWKNKTGGGLMSSSNQGSQPNSYQQPGKRQNLPLFENDKTEQQKLLELVEALKKYQGSEY